MDCGILPGRKVCAVNKEAPAIMPGHYLCTNRTIPTGNLDSRSSEAVIGAFLEAQKELNATTFMVTHDSFSASYCDRVIVMKDGRVYTELTSNGDHRQFMEELLDVLRKMNGGE